MRMKRGLSSRRFSQRWQTRPSWVTRSTPAKRARPWKLIRVLLMLTVTGPRPFDEGEEGQIERPLRLAAGEELVLAEPAAAVRHVAGDEALPAFGAGP